jgi:nucleotide-binding universal stress UspA family protein
LKEYPEFREFDKERISSELSPGLAKEEIQKICSEYKPDLVIMGTKGRNIHENAIIGSLTEFAINKLRYPVLAIPEHYSFIGEKNLKRIAYLTDFDETDFGSIKKLMSFTSLLGLTICCAHIGGKSDNWDRLKMDGLRNYFKNVYKETQVECEILKPGENILHSIDDYIKRNSINILSLTSRRRNIIEKLTKPSFTRKLFYHTNIPLLVFHS